ncbi:MAG: hypothetical protein QXP70_01040 [Methanomassiliicoccales archaeon]
MQSLVKELSEVYRVISGRYVDSVLLMQISREAENMGGVAKAGAMVATPENLSFLKLAGFHPPENVGSDSILLAVDASTDQEASAALEHMIKTIDRGMGIQAQKYSLNELQQLTSGADFTVMLISTPGQYVRDIAEKALDAGINLHIFSSNVPIEQEVELKKKGHQKGLLVMGPDCGTSIIDGRGIGFANSISGGNEVGVIGSSGTGIQELTVQLDAAGIGVSYAIGTGSNDLTPEVGALTTMQAISMLRDKCKSIAVVCKKPDISLQNAVIDAISDIPSAFVSLGSDGHSIRGKTLVCGVIDDAVAYLSQQLGKSISAQPEKQPLSGISEDRTLLRGYFVGGSLCYQAQSILTKEGVQVYSNSPLDGKFLVERDFGDVNVCIDTGAEEYVMGRPHPMIDPVARNSLLVKDSARQDVRVLLFDVMLGYGSAPDPLAGLEALKEGPALVASVCGTEKDSQNLGKISRRLEERGAYVFRSAASAAKFAARIMKGA